MSFQKYSDAEWAAYDRRPSAYAEASMDEWMSHQHGQRAARGRRTRPGHFAVPTLCPHCHLEHAHHERCGRLGRK